MGNYVTIQAYPNGPKHPVHAKLRAWGIPENQHDMYIQRIAASVTQKIVGHPIDIAYAYCDLYFSTMVPED